MKRIYFDGQVFVHDEFIFPKNALSALYRLKKAGISLGFDLEKLHDEQQLVLMQETMIDEETNAENADLIIRLNERTGMILISGDNLSETFIGDDWLNLTDNILFPDRVAHIERNTNETQIALSLNLDGHGESDIHTGLYFYDHMLHQISKHGHIDLYVLCKGDLKVDEHHTIEDVAIVLGEALNQAVGDKKGIERYSFHLAMDEAKAEVALDLSGRPYLVFDGDFKREYVGDVPTEMIKHFFHSLAMHLKATIHIKISGENEHHMIESCFKGFAVALRQALARSERSLGKLPSSKGVL
jgi:imidazoleglycerol-phosphate dehydratase/histidinol-phosphatase